MTSWLFENPVPIAILMAAIAAILAWRALAGGGGRRELTAAGVAALLGLSAIAAGRLVTTPGEHARAVVEELVAFAEEAEVQRAAALFAPNAVLNYGRRENAGVSIEAIRSALNSLAASNRIESNRITRLRFHTIDDRTGEVELSCSTTTARSMTAVPTEWLIRVRRIGNDPSADGAWRIDRITFERVFGQAPTPRIW
ncbi:MAG: hypothetical protein ACOYMM_08935 [Phycisphaerales bacterium]|jgi:hypothetical protein